MKTTKLEAHASPADTLGAGQSLQAEIDRVVSQKVGLYLTAQIILSMVAMTTIQWLLNVPAPFMLVAGLLYVAGIFSFSSLRLRRVIQKVERSKQVASGA